MKKNSNYTDINQKRDIVINAWDKEKVNSLDEIFSFRIILLYPFLFRLLTRVCEKVKQFENAEFLSEV